MCCIDSVFGFLLGPDLSDLVCTDLRDAIVGRAPAVAAALGAVFVPLVAGFAGATVASKLARAGSG